MRMRRDYLESTVLTPVASSGSCRSVTPAFPNPPQVHTAVVGEQFQTDYNVHELPGFSSAQSTSAESLVFNCALLARNEMLEAENASLKKQQNVEAYFTIENILHDDKLIHLFTLYTVSWLL